MKFTHTQGSRVRHKASQLEGEVVGHRHGAYKTVESQDPQTGKQKWKDISFQEAAVLDAKGEMSFYPESELESIESETTSTEVKKKK